jgi:hypothetical protein
MYRIDNSTVAPTLPTPGAVGPNPNGYFTGGVPGVVAATIVDSDWLNAVQEEICNAITGSGQTLDKTNRNQLSTALSAIGAAETGRLLRTSIYRNLAGTGQQVSVDGAAFTTVSAGTFTSLAATKRCEVVVIGGGGAGGGGAATGASSISAGAGGGAGGFAFKTLTTGFSGGIAVTVGQGGSGAAGAAGVTGGTSSFGTVMSATGGTGGSLGASTVIGSSSIEGSGPGGTGTGGDINATGGAGGAAFYANNTNPSGGVGGWSFYGGGGNLVTGSGTGQPAGSAGAGGGGGCQGSPSAGAAGGGNGAAGEIVVREYT